MKRETRAILTRKRERGDSDLFVTFFTEDFGRLDTIAFGARRSKKRFPVLETLHTLKIEVDGSAEDELLRLQHADVEVGRVGYLSDLDRIMTAASGITEWLDKVAMPEQANKRLWEATIAFLDEAQTVPKGRLTEVKAVYGVKLLSAIGKAPVSLKTSATPGEVFRLVELSLREG